jgi:mRNA interferase MazF
VDMSVLPGEVVWARPDVSVGREQAGRRPAVVVSNASFHDAITTLVLVVPVTSVDREWGNHVALAGSHDLPDRSFAMTEQVRVMARERIVARAGSVDDATLETIREWLRAYLV